MATLVAIGGLSLIGATWPLWTPQTDFPQVPWFAAAGMLSSSWQWTLLATLAGALLGVLLLPAHSLRRRAALLLAAAAFIALVLPDQHRFQPWAYEFMLLALCIALVRPCRAIALIRLLVISIYLYSGLSKLDSVRNCSKQAPS